MPQSTTEEIKSRLDIVDVVREYIELKQAGTNLKAKCPFHTEKTPSFMVSRDRQMYHCFGCSEHGDIFTFVMKMEGIEFPEALRILAKKAGVEIKNDDPRTRNEKTKLFDILKFATRLYQEHLRRLPETHPLKKYIAERGLKQETLETFQIGFAPDSWDTIVDALNKKNIRTLDGVAAGLIVRRDDGTGFYDRFRGRLMFPIADANGNVVGFGGRVIPNFEAQSGGREAAKYINTPQSPVYNKSAVLYNLHLAKPAIRKQKTVVVVEGYMDCITAFMSGTENVVAASGTAFTVDQAKLLKRFTDTVHLAFDMDEAGVVAASRGVQVLLAESLTVRVISLAQGKDPDELIRKDVAAWKKALDNPKLFLDFAFEQTLKNKDLGNVDDKKEIAKVLLPLLSGIANPIEQAHYVQKLSSTLRVEEDVLRDSMRKLKQERVVVSQGRALKKRVEQSAHDASLRELFSVFLKKPDYFASAHKAISPDAIPTSPWKELYNQAVFQYTADNHFDPKVLRARITSSDHVKELLELLDIAELGASRIPDHAEKEGEHIIKSLMQEYLKLRLTQVSHQISEAENANNKEQLASLIETFEQLTGDLKRFTS